MGNYLGDISKTCIAVIKFCIYVGLGSYLPQTQHIIYFPAPWNTGKKYSVPGREHACESDRPVWSLI